MFPSPRKACHVCLALPGRASTGLGLVLAHHSLFVWLGLGPIVIIRFRARGLRAIDITRLKLWQSVFLASSMTACCSAIIIDIKSVLSQKSLDMFCQNFHIPNEVHPQLPSPNQTIHEMPTGMIGVYTRFFEYANFRLPFSTFLVNVLKHYRIHISQLSVIGAAKVSHFEIMCRVHGFKPTVGLFRCFYVNSKNKGWMSFSKHQGYNAVCYTKPLDSLKGWNDNFFWVDAFTCPASFLWHTGKSVPKDPFPKSSEFNADHYATLVAYPALFHKYPEPFLCLVGMSRNYTLDENTYPEFLRDNDEEMDLISFIRTVDPTKVRIGERQRAEDEPKLLDTTVGRVVPLLPISPALAESELEASVDKLFDEGGSGNQLRHPKKRKNIVADAGGPSHPPKKLREDHGTLSGASNVEVRGGPIPTLPFVTSSVSTTPEREGGDYTDSVVGTNLQTAGPPQRFIISSDSSHHSGANVVEAKVDSFARPSVPLMSVSTTVTSTVDPTTTVKEKFVESSVFGGDSSSAGEADHTVGGFFDLTGSDLIVGGIRTVVSSDTNLQKVYVPQWSVTNGSRLDDGRVCREMVDEFAPPNAEVRMRAEYNIRERRRLKSVMEEKDSLLKAKDEEIGNLKAQLLLKKAEAAEAIRLRAEASKFETVEKSLQDEVKNLKEHNAILEKEKSELGVTVADLAASVKVREQEVSDLDAMVTFVKSQNDNLVNQVHELEASSAILREKVTVYENYTEQLEKWLLTHDIELAVTKCLNSPEYLSALGAAISKAIEKGMQDGLAIGITHGKEGRVLTYVAAYNPSAEDDYFSALQQLQNVNFYVLVELKFNKDLSVDTLMNILRLEDTLAERLGLNESQPHVDQLMIPIHHSPDQTIIGATALSLALDVSSSHVQRIKDNITNHRSALRNVFIPLAEPLSTMALEGKEGTSGTAPDIITALSVTFVSASFILPISTDDYEVVHADGQEGVGADGQAIDGNADPFPIVNDVELNIS
ncbi:hypothetical protein Tco_0732785 [Tanacetum coccineum]